MSSEHQKGDELIEAALAYAADGLSIRRRVLVDAVTG